MKNKPLIRARKAKGFTQKELSKRLGCSKAAVSNWENGHSNPSLVDAFKLSRILEADINELFSYLSVQESCTKEQSA